MRARPDSGPACSISHPRRQSSKTPARRPCSATCPDAPPEGHAKKSLDGAAMIPWRRHRAKQVGSTRPRMSLTEKPATQKQPVSVGMRARTAAPSLCSLANRARATHGHNPSMGISVARQPAAQPSVGNLVPRQPAAQPQRGDLGAGAACGATLAWDLGAEAACGAIQHGGLRRGQHGAECNPFLFVRHGETARAHVTAHAAGSQPSTLLGSRCAARACPAPTCDLVPS